MDAQPWKKYTISQRCVVMVELTVKIVKVRRVPGEAVLWTSVLTRLDNPSETGFFAPTGDQKPGFLAFI
jgi:hypothetical protein